MIDRFFIVGLCWRRVDELKQSCVHGQAVDVDGDGGLVEWALLAMQVGQAHLAHGVAAAQADGAAVPRVELIAAHWTRQELRPTRCLYWHPKTTNITLPTIHM